MRKKELKELKAKSLAELKNLANVKRSESLRAKASLAAGKEKNLKKVKSLRYDLAQILTVIREKELFEKETADVDAKKGEGVNKK